MPTYSPDGSHFWDEESGRWLPVPSQQQNLLSSKVRPSLRSWVARQPSWILATIGGGAAACVLVAVGAAWLYSGTSTAEAVPAIMSTPLAPQLPTATSTGMPTTSSAPVSTPASDDGRLGLEDSPGIHLGLAMEGCWNSFKAQHGDRPADPVEGYSASLVFDTYMAQMDWDHASYDILDCVKADPQWTCAPFSGLRMNAFVDGCYSVADPSVNETWFDAMLGILTAVQNGDIRAATTTPGASV